MIFDDPRVYSKAPSEESLEESFRHAAQVRQKYHACQDAISSAIRLVERYMEFGTDDPMLEKAIVILQTVKE